MMENLFARGGKVSFTTMVMLLLVWAGACYSGPSVTILVNPSPFSRAQEAAQGEEQVNWWDDNLTDDRACTECFAAVELVKFLPRCTGLAENDIKFQAAEKLPKSGDVILIGSRSSNPLIAAQPAGEGVKLENREAYNIRTIQEDGRTITIIEGGDREGTLYGVYGYLEQLGMRFFGLGEQGTVYPAKPAELPQKVNITESPSFISRGFWAWEDRGNNDFFLWMAHNRMNFWTANEKEIHLLKKLGIKLTEGGHIIQEYFLGPRSEYPYNHPNFKGDEDKPNDPYKSSDEYVGDTNGDGKLTYFEAHPEWYGLIDGKRSDYIKGDAGHNYCSSNVDATGELAKNLVQSLIDGRWRYVDIVTFWMLDVGKWCECKNCEKQGTYTDRLFEIVHTVLTEMRRARSEGRLQRNVELAALAYMETLAPPSKPLPEGFSYENLSMTFFPISRCYAHALADPACTEINLSTLKDYQGWTMGQGRFYTGPIFIGEYYNVSSMKCLPTLYTRIMATDIPWYYRTGARHFHYMHTPTQLWGTWTLNQYLLGRLLWNHQASADEIFADYFAQYYPTTNAVTRKFYENLEKAQANIKVYKHGVRINNGSYSLRTKLNKNSGGVFPLDHFHYEPYHPLLNDGPDLVEMVDYMSQARQALDEALIKCNDETEQVRLLEDERRFAYGEDMIMFIYHLVRTDTFIRRSDIANARVDFAEVEKYAKKLEAITDLTMVASSHANAKNGLIATGMMNIFEDFKKKLAQTNP